MQGILAN